MHNPADPGEVLR